MKEITTILNEAKEHKLLKFLYENPKKLVLYGAGSSCARFLRQAERYHLPIQYIIDSSAEKSGEIYGIEIKCIDEILSDIDQYKFIITTVFVHPVCRNLKAKGVAEDDLYVPDRYAIQTGATNMTFARVHAYLAPLDVYINREHYLKAYHLLGDEKSKKIYCALLWYRLYGRYYMEPGLYNDDESYFNNEFISLKDDEFFLDVGAYTGDSIIGFLLKTEDRYSKIYAVEANKERCDILKSCIIDETNKKKIEILNCGVGAVRETVPFDGGTSFQGDEKLEIYPLDELLDGKKVTVIKMDIEGMEQDALKGAKHIIEEQKPVLAICIYHLVTDLWEIIELLHDILPEYQFCIEQPFHVGLTETVLYAWVKN